jgi:ATP-binding cassette, subfamily C, bacterial CydC
VRKPRGQRKRVRSVRTTWTLPGQTPQTKLRDVLDRVGLTDLLAGLPEGLDTWIGDQGVRVSGGERQRLALARTLLQDSPI